MARGEKECEWQQCATEKGSPDEEEARDCLVEEIEFGSSVRKG